MDRVSGLRTVLRTGLGFAALGFGSSVLGTGDVAIVLVLQGLPADMGAGTGSSWCAPRATW